MSNDVVINVKVDDSKADFGGVERGLKRVREQGASMASTLGGMVADALSSAAQGAVRMGQGLAQAAGQAAVTNAVSTGASGGVNALITALMAAAAAAAAAAAGFVALAPAILVAAGAAAAGAAAMVGLGNAMAVLSIGFGGIGEALGAHSKAMGGAGGAARNTAEQEHQAAQRIKSATRALTDAKRAEREAIADVNRARLSEIERLKDLDAAIKGGAISEKEAALDLQEAKLAIQNMDAGMSNEDKQRLQNRLDRAQLEYDETVRRNRGLAEERRKADKVGIEGSDQVQEALKRQAAAHEQVVRAQEGLAEAQRKVATASAGAGGGVNAFNEAMKKLSPNARELVRTLVALSDKWDALKKRVQDRLLAGFSDEIKGLAAKWMPVLETTLTDMAGRLNTIGKNTAKTLGSKDFIENFKSASSAGGDFISNVGGGVPALIDGFMRLAQSASPVLKVIGNAVRGIFEWFDKWMTSAQKSGKLKSFMEQAATTLDRIFTIGKLVFQVIGEFFSILFPSSKKTSDSVFDSIIRQLGVVKDWLQDPQNREAIQRIADKFGEFIAWMVNDAMPVIADLVTLLIQGAYAVAKNWNKIKDFFSSLVLKLRELWWNFVKFMLDRLDGVISLIDKTLGGIVPGLSKQLNSARAGLNQFRDDANKALSGIKDEQVTIEIRQVFTAVGETIASVAKQLQDVGTLIGRKGGTKKGKATGGISSGGLEWVGEHGPELRNLAPGSRVYSAPDSARMAGAMGGGELSGTVRLAGSGQAERGLIAELFRVLRVEIGRNYGGSVQKALGS